MTGRCPRLIPGHCKILASVQVLTGFSSKLYRSSSVIVFLRIILIMCLSTTLGRADDAVLDLMTPVRNRINTYTGVARIPGPPSHPLEALRFYGSNRNVKVGGDHLSSRIVHLLSNSRDLTLLLAIRQERGNVGTLLAIDNLVEIESSGRRDEIRLHYSINNGHSRRLRTEVFPYRLADDSWHKLALTVSGNSLSLYVDCHRVYHRTLPQFSLDGNLSPANLSIWLGQRNGRHSFLRGALAEAKIVFRPNGYLVQCPHHADTAACPTCGQFQQLSDKMLELSEQVLELTARLRSAEARLLTVESCECSHTCRDDRGVIRHEGETWQRSCDNCTCQDGQVTCTPKNCPEVNCKNPVILPGQCCPSCLGKCWSNSKWYEHGETVKRDCIECVCTDSQMKCRHMDKSLCPKLDCPEAERIKVPGECCQFCRGVDYCARSNECHHNATCVNIQTGARCSCNDGFTGDGKQCEDIDECATVGGTVGHHCQTASTKCVNTLGSYECECLSGYHKFDGFSCSEVNECALGTHKCHRLATCSNTVGSYNCTCPPGYTGDGLNCEPICNITCENGGRCVAPDTCSCRRGYSGARCQLDVDECAHGLHECDVAKSTCINVPGWYYCKCHKGFEHSPTTGLCEDINECELGIHTCHSTATCINTMGSFNCDCLDNTTCSLSCDYNGREQLNGEKWFDENNRCEECECSNGVVSCGRLECDCSSQKRNPQCCPQCEVTAPRCAHPSRPNISYSNGERWTHQCQTCECLFGEVDCWPSECPRLLCENPVQLDGDCCPRCPEDLDPCAPSPFPLNSTDPKGCTYREQLYSSGDVVPIDTGDECTTCNCKVQRQSRLNDLGASWYLQSAASPSYYHSNHRTVISAVLSWQIVLALSCTLLLLRNNR